MEIKKKLTATRGEGGNGEKKGKGHQGTHIKDTWTKTMGVGEDGMWKVGVGVGRAEESIAGKWGQP